MPPPPPPHRCNAACGFTDSAAAPRFSRFPFHPFVVMRHACHPWPAAVALVVFLTPAWGFNPTAASAVPLFKAWGSVVHGTLRLSASTLEGPALVLGAATLVTFDIGGGRPCHPTAPALAVGGTATGSHGVLKGSAALGPRSVLAPSVGTPCANPADPDRGVVLGGPDAAGPDAWALMQRHLAASRTLCAAPPSGRVAVEDTVLKLYPAPETAGATCVDVFTVHDPPSSLTSVQYFGTRRVVINYLFRGSMSLRGVDMATLHAPSTLHSVCGGGGVEGLLRLRHVEVSGSVLAPGIHVDARSTEFRGRLAVGSLDGQVVVRYEDYNGAAPERIAAELCVA